MNTSANMTWCSSIQGGNTVTHTPTRTPEQAVAIKTCITMYPYNHKHKYREENGILYCIVMSDIVMFVCVCVLCLYNLCRVNFARSLTRNTGVSTSDLLMLRQEITNRTRTVQCVNMTVRVLGTSGKSLCTV